MLSKADFQQAIADTIGAYPDLAVRYHASDPIVLQHLEAIATMLAMTSQMIDVARGEVFLKARDATIRADAAMRGIVPKAKPAEVLITVQNRGRVSVAISTNRLLLDNRGRTWIVTAGANILAGESGEIRAEQRYTYNLTYTVTADEPFHAVEIPSKQEDGQTLMALSVSDSTGDLDWADHYTNVFPEDRIYHVEADDRQRYYIRFGMRDVVGIQPNEGDVFTIRADYTFGDVRPDVGSRFAFDALIDPNEAFIVMEMRELRVRGHSPMGVDVLRMLARYPSIYNYDAVFLGEFDFLIWRHFPDLKFLSVWNERIEERVRGVSTRNINTLFIAVVGADGREPAVIFNAPCNITYFYHDSVAIETPECRLHYLGEPDLNVDGTWYLGGYQRYNNGIEIPENDWTELQHAIREVVRRADDSYRVKFITPIVDIQDWTIGAFIGASYIPETVEDKIRASLVEKFGEVAMKRGQVKIPIQEVYAHLRYTVPEIADPGADIQVTLEPPPARFLPERWSFVTEDSISITVSSANIASAQWGFGY